MKRKRGCPLFLHVLVFLTFVSVFHPLLMQDKVSYFTFVHPSDARLLVFPPGACCTNCQMSYTEWAFSYFRDFLSFFQSFLFLFTSFLSFFKSFSSFIVFATRDEIGTGICSLYFLLFAFSFSSFSLPISQILLPSPNANLLVNTRSTSIAIYSGATAVSQQIPFLHSPFLSPHG